MGLTSLQVSMDSSDWFHLQGTMQEDDESSSGGGDMEMLTCTRPNNNMTMERRLRPPQDEAVKCPRCESTHTKFCYYNNYSLSQPRYFCKTCRRYWTKGGTLRNIPVGGGCRKTSKHKPSNNNSNKLLPPPSSSSADHNINQTDLQLSYPADIHLLGAHHPNNVNAAAGPIELMMEGIASTSRNNTNSEFMSNYFHFGMGQDHYLNNNNNIINVGGSYGQRVMIPYEDHQSIALMDVKPKMLSLDWHDHQQQQGRVLCTDTGRDSFGYPDAMGSNWGGGMINGYGSSATNHHFM